MSPATRRTPARGSSSARSIAAACFAAAFGFAAAADGRAMRDMPPTARTGGFGEETCQSCHFHAEVDAGSGSLTLRGVPDRFEYGQRYVLTLIMTHPAMAVAGFQLSARFEDGAQAGSFAPTAFQSRSLAVSTDAGIQYVHHLLDGTAPAAPDTARWTILWTAPGSGGHVIFHAVGSAGDDDDSPLGDFVYTTRIASRR
jgi:hypothetical protein